MIPLPFNSIVSRMGAVVLAFFIVFTAQAQELSQEDMDSLPDTDLMDTGATSLALYGFSDFTFSQSLMKESNRWNNLIDQLGISGRYPSFYIGNLNLYLDAKIWKSWRSLVEIRFLYLPHGAQNFTEDNLNADRTDTTVPDYSNRGDKIQWGGIIIERVWIEYELHDLLTLRAGHWIVPVGIWNVDHGSPTIIPVRTPYILVEKLFPRSQTGLMVFGEVSLDSMRLGYNLTVSNGRGPLQNTMDLDHNKGLGGRAFMSLDWPGKIEIGISYYRGRFTDRHRVSENLITAESFEFNVTQDVIEQYDELAMGFDLLWIWNNLLFQTEFVFNDRRYTEEGRPRSGAGSFLKDRRAWGVYGLVGYRTPFLNIMPYFMFEHFENVAAGLNNYASTAYYLGLNSRITPTVTLKIQFDLATVWFVDPSIYDAGYTKIVEAQIAWAF